MTLGNMGAEHLLNRIATFLGRCDLEVLTKAALRTSAGIERADLLLLWETVCREQPSGPLAGHGGSPWDTPSE
jgi:hypothetical protein